MHLRPFEIVLIGVFTFFALIGLISFSFLSSRSTEEENPYGKSIVIWGTLDASAVNGLIQNAEKSDDALGGVVSYRRIDPREFDSELINGIAEGRSPDLILIPHTALVTHRAKLMPILPETFPPETFRDAYIDGAGIFMRSDGIYAIPLAADPLVLYWNRDLFGSGGLARPPKTWESLALESIPALTKRTDTELTASAIGLGEYENIRHAKDILSMLLFQAGSTIVDEENARYTLTFNKSIANGIPPAQAVFSFYTSFSTPSQSAYTWNRSLPEDYSLFLQNKLAMYIGPASERAKIDRENPNLAYDMTTVPQGSGATVYRNYATWYGFAIPRASTNRVGAYRVALKLTDDQNSAAFAAANGLAPASRSLYGSASQNAGTDVVKQSALIARGWLDPAPHETDVLFKGMVSDITAGRGKVSEIISDAAYSLESLFR